MWEWFFQTTYTIVLPALLSYIAWLLKDQRKVRNANAKGTLCLLRDKLIHYHDKYVAQGDIPPYAMDNWEKMYQAYTDLGGNGTVKQMDKDVRNLKIK